MEIARPCLVRITSLFHHEYLRIILKHGILSFSVPLLSALPFMSILNSLPHKEHCLWIPSPSLLGDPRCLSFCFCDNN